MSKRDFTSAKAKEALLKDKEKKCCGECCWYMSHSERRKNGMETKERNKA
jgi:hypothetical protein